ncbi:glyceraldehyde 3-phosphate dehydrogenase [Asanoa ferruginea]|uniref:Glyceraldehyde 3-phosphate dehydrogenase n=1 Tax=Asanoa ferruginea TaxID=53367 RepID=A0A3D9ZR71_9ACTN|nr:type I glyceraldehyde-3-phosphate dehydrogenase [Asanoa ferruginea]REF96170.1 glyceraldehyde 3-phosphate dehydrogenase [Asanoa ferruginea]GIF49313.1 glyceraldehyde-3-phosphate dehydrogenase [Asanoa ferruginea]
MRVGINGCGRVGRSFWRAALERPGFDVVAVNDTALTPQAIAHLLNFDSVRGRAQQKATVESDRVVLGGQPVTVSQNPTPEEIPWGELGVDLVVESTGRYFRAERLRGHLAAGARKVLVSAAAPDPDATIVIGVNEHDYDPTRHHIVSPACCTGNAVAPVVATLRAEFGVAGVFINTIHAYDGTHSSLHDAPHRDRRMGRAAGVNIVPVKIKDTTRSLGYVFPDLAQHIEGMAMRVPAGIGCAVEVVAELNTQATVEQVNAAFRAAANGQFKGRLGYTDESLVSSDFVGATEVSILDAQLTTMLGRNAKLVVWHDNEIGYARVLADTVELIAAAG